MPQRSFSLLLLISVALVLASSSALATRARWRPANETELRKIIPVRAAVVNENIETEFRTASGVTDGAGKFIAGVVMITAGYSAEGKYSHFFITQSRLTIGDISLAPGEYVFGTQRISNEAVRVSFYRAANGESLGHAEARVNRKSAAVRSLLITPPANGKAAIQIGRFVFEYKVSD
jgi:hypothetical protein